MEEVALNLAGAGAFDSLEPNRRKVKWEIGLRYRPINSQLLLPLPVKQDLLDLEAPSVRYFDSKTEAAIRPEADDPMANGMYEIISKKRDELHEVPLEQRGREQRRRFQGQGCVAVPLGRPGSLGALQSQTLAPQGQTSAARGLGPAGRDRERHAVRAERLPGIRRGNGFRRPMAVRY